MTIFRRFLSWATTPKNKPQSLPPKNESQQQRLNREFEEKRVKKVAKSKKKNPSKPKVGQKIDNSIDGYELEVGDPFELIYFDVDGNRSRRAITFMALERKNGNDYIIAFCDSRQDTRTFRVDRIESLTNLATGEFVL